MSTIALTASSPKLRPKNKNAAAEATAYDQVARLVRISWAPCNALATEGRPMRKNAMAKKSHGADRT